MKRILSLLFAGLAFWSAAVPAGTVLAALGQPADSVADDRRALNASQGATTERPLYTIRGMQSPAVAVREYISASNVVFGIAWNGMVHPDLDQLLGRYAEEYRQALKKEPRNPGRRGGRRVQAEKIVVETWGHMRNLQGRAYVPDLVPEGVDISDIK